MPLQVNLPSPLTGYGSRSDESRREDWVRGTNATSSGEFIGAARHVGSLGKNQPEGEDSDEGPQLPTLSLHLSHCQSG